MIDELQLVLGFYVFVLGLCTGSFLNVASLRFLWGQDIVFMPSRCPKCKNNLKWYHNIPVVSYIFLKGKCAFCKEPISIQYPIVELVNALLYLAVFIFYGFTFKTLFLCILVSFFIVMTITDLKEKVVFNAHTYPVIFLGLLYNLLKLGDITILESILGVVAGFLFFEIIARMGYLFSKSRAFGEGDTIIAMGISAFFGWKILFLVIALSVVFQAIVAIPMMFIKNYKIKNYKMCQALTVCVACVIFSILLSSFMDYLNPLLALLLVMLLFLALAWGIKIILGSIKNKTEEELFCLPFGPALAFCATFSIFFGNQIINYIISNPIF